MPCPGGSFPGETKQPRSRGRQYVLLLLVVLISSQLFTISLRVLPAARLVLTTLRLYYWSLHSGAVVSLPKQGRQKHPPINQSRYPFLSLSPPPIGQTHWRQPFGFAAVRNPLRVFLSRLAIHYWRGSAARRITHNFRAVRGRLEGPVNFFFLPPVRSARLPSSPRS